MMEQRYVKPTATHVAAELLDKKPGVRVPILTLEEAQNHKVMLNEKEVLHSHRLYWFGRRTQDIVFSLLALVVLSPLMLIIMAAIYIDDPHASPVFSQPRVGRGGRVFKFYKFRSMRANAEDMLKDLLKDNEMDGPVFKMANDPRITRVGRFNEHCGAASAAAARGRAIRRVYFPAAVCYAGAFLLLADSAAPQRAFL